jgi:hypothetical protein
MRRLSLTRNLIPRRRNRDVAILRNSAMTAGAAAAKGF